MQDLFSHASSAYQPLADRMRTQTLDQVVGQTHLLEAESILNLNYSRQHRTRKAEGQVDRERVLANNSHVPPTPLTLSI